MIRLLTPLLLVVLLLISACSDSPQLERLSDDEVILALGDSLTFGTGSTPEKSYPSILQTLSNRTVINAGIPGETSDKTLLRVKQLLHQHKPALVILCIGGNDILRRKNLAQTQNNIQQIIDIVQQQGSELVLIAVPEFGLYPTAPDFYQTLAEQNKLPLDNETIPALLRNSQYKSDTIHPNQAGYQLLADEIFILLQESGAL